MEGEKICYNSKVKLHKVSSGDFPERVYEDSCLKLKKLPKTAADKKRSREKAVIACMIRIYCKGNKHGSPICPKCMELLSYAHKKTDVCPFMETKTFCSNCRVHCYDKTRREEIRRVMKYAGWRILFVHPVMAVKHVILTVKNHEGKEREENGKMKYNPVKLIFILFAFVSLGIGMVGIILPVLPTTPFLLLSSFCFAKGSKRFHTWFCSTKLYRNHLDSFVKSRSMTLRTKIRILIPASLMLITAFCFTPGLHGKIAILCVILFKYYYFIFRIKTVPGEEPEDFKKEGITKDKYQGLEVKQDAE